MRQANLWMILILLFGWGQAQQPAGPSDTSAKPSPPSAAQAGAKKSITLSFPSEGERYWWIEMEEGKPETPPNRVSDKKTVVETTATSGVLWVQDGKTGNLARFDLKSVPATIEFKSDTWTHVSRLQVEVKSNDKPVASAVVSVKDKSGKTQTQVIERTAYGVAEFKRVALGPVKVEARYGDGKTASQDVDVNADREELVPNVQMAISADVPTVEPPKTETPDSSAPSTSKPADGESAGGGSIIGTILNMILGIGIVSGVLYLVLRFVKGNDQKVAELMQKMGVQLPSQQTDPATIPAPGDPQAAPPIVPEGYCAFCGQKKDPVTGACACAIGSTPGGVSTATVGSGGSPRLVGLQGAYAGQVFNLSEEVITIGREVGNSIVLNNDSTTSRRHAQILHQNGNVVVQDLGSSNGTYVNGVRISTETLIRPGDTVQFGGSSFKFEA